MARRQLAVVLAVVSIASTGNAYAFEVHPEHDWSFNVGNLRFGYVEWPRDVPAANYSNAQPFELHFGPSHTECGSRAAVAACVALPIFVATLALVVWTPARRGKRQLGSNSSRQQPTGG
jgi:hypothetical protein